MVNRRRALNSGSPSCPRSYFALPLAASLSSAINTSYDTEIIVSSLTRLIAITSCICCFTKQLDKREPPAERYLVKLAKLHDAIRPNVIRNALREAG